MPTIEVAIMAQRKEREIAISRQRLEHNRRLEELDALAKKAGCPPRFGCLDGLRRLAAAALRGHRPQLERRRLPEAGEPLALTVMTAGPRAMGGRPMPSNPIAVAHRSSC